MSTHDVLNMRKKDYSGLEETDRTFYKHQDLFRTVEVDEVNGRDVSIPGREATLPQLHALFINFKRSFMV